MSSADGKTMIVLGSGGHTMEMVALLPHLETGQRVFVVAETDAMSSGKVDHRSTDKVVKIPRAREVRQSWLTSVLTTLWALICSVMVVFRERPSLLLCNGPGTCVPICLSAYVFHVLGWQSCRIVYVESVCRVETLSLSALILRAMPFADVLVQWPQLKTKYPDCVYLDRTI